jgi:hypothetical protein
MESVGERKKVLELQSFFLIDGGHVVAQWLRHYATGQKVAGSRPDEMYYLY